MVEGLRHAKKRVRPPPPPPPHIPRCIASIFFPWTADNGKTERNTGAFTRPFELHTHDLEPEQILQYRGKAHGSAQEDIERGTPKQ